MKCRETDSREKDFKIKQEAHVTYRLSEYPLLRSSNREAPPPHTHTHTHTLHDSSAWLYNMTTIHYHREDRWVTVPTEKSSFTAQSIKKPSQCPWDVSALQAISTLTFCFIPISASRDAAGAPRRRVKPLSSKRNMAPRHCAIGAGRASSKTRRSNCFIYCIGRSPWVQFTSHPSSPKQRCLMSSRRTNGRR